MINDPSFLRWHKRIMLLTLIIAVLFTAKIITHAQTPSGSIFAAQCGTVNSVRVARYAPRIVNGVNVELIVKQDYYVRNLERLSTLEVSPGVWYGYENAAPFGGTYPDNARGYWRWVVITETDCGTFQTWAWDNGDETLTLFAFYNTESNCDASGAHCGMHNFEFYYVAVDEWQRVVAR